MRLPDGGTEALAQKIAHKALDCEPAVAALARASAVLRAKGLSEPIVERLLSSNNRAADLTLWVLSAGVTDSNPADYDAIRTAVKLAGVSTVWHAALVANLLDFAMLLMRSSSTESPDLVAPSWACADMAYWLSGKHIVDPSDAFARALFADVGLFALFCALPKVYLALAKSDTQQTLIEFERECLGVDHQQIAQLVLKELKFPDTVVSFATKHHENPLDLGMEEKVVKAAYIAVEAQSGCCGLNTCPEELSLPILEAALLKETDVPELKSVARGFLTRANKISTLELPDAA